MESRQSKVWARDYCKEILAPFYQAVEILAQLDVTPYEILQSFDAV